MEKLRSPERGSNAGEKGWKEKWRKPGIREIAGDEGG
jgi:hypothetical protein